MRDTRLEREIPRLPDEVVPEAVVRLLLHQHEPPLLINAPRLVQHVVRPQRHRPVADAPREANALVHQAPTDSEPPRRWLDVEQAQLADLVRLPDEKHRADDIAILLGDPASLPLGVEVLDE